MEWLESLIMGVVQGLTEFLPVSSDGHLNITDKLFARFAGLSRPEKENIFFFVMLHVGTLMAIIVHYRSAWITALKGLLGSTDVPTEYRRNPVIWVGLLAGVATSPLVPLKLFVMKWIEESFKGTIFTGIGFLITAAVLILTIFLQRRGGEGKGPAQTTLLDALLIGLAQMFAPLPGVSRSGLTVAAGLGLGLSRTWAVGFSLLMAVPAIAGAAVFGIKDVDSNTLTHDRIAQTIAAATVAGLIGYAAIVWLLKIVKSGKMWYFSVYLIVLGITLLTVAAIFGDVPSADTGKTNAPDRSAWFSPARPADRGREARALGLWIVPSKVARIQILSSLGGKAGATRDLRVWCWDDLWELVAEHHSDTPIRLGFAGARAVFSEAVRRAQEAGELGATKQVVHWPGFRRRVRDRIDSWTRIERSPNAQAPDQNATTPDEWAIYRHYHAILDQLGAVDFAGFGVWASKALAEHIPEALTDLTSVTFLDLNTHTPAIEHVVSAFEQSARSVRITLAYDPDTELAESFEPALRRRERWLTRGYEERSFSMIAGRPAGLESIERRALPRRRSSSSQARRDGWSQNHRCPQSGGRGSPRGARGETTAR